MQPNTKTQDLGLKNVIHVCKSSSCLSCVSDIAMLVIVIDATASCSHQIKNLAANESFGI